MRGWSLPSPDTPAIHGIVAALFVLHAAVAGAAWPLAVAGANVAMALVQGRRLRAAGLA